MSFFAIQNDLDFDSFKISQNILCTFWLRIYYGFFFNISVAALKGSPLPDQSMLPANFYIIWLRKKNPKKKKKSQRQSVFVYSANTRQKNVLFVTKKMQKIFCFSSLSTSAKESCSHNFHIPAEISAETLNQISLKENGFKNLLSLVHLAEQISFRFIKINRMSSYAYLYQLPRNDHPGHFLVTMNVS